MEGRRRHETIRRLIDRHGTRLPRSAITDAAWELDVSRATLYRLIELYREFGTVDKLQPAKMRRRGTRALSSEVERIIDTEIRQVYLKPTRPTVTHLMAQIHARCAEEGVAPPHRRTVEARVRAVDRRVRGLKRGESDVIQATSAKLGEYTGESTARSRANRPHGNRYPFRGKSRGRLWIATQTM
jgi:putative transposase